MYQIGELVQHGTSGVCKIEDIVQDVPGLAKDTQYYVLVPVGRRDGRIYSPVGVGEVRMRQILSAEETKDLLGKAMRDEKLTIANEKQCESIYREELQSGSCYRWLILLKTLYSRKAARVSAGKKMTSTDERFLKRVEDRIKEEFTLSIGKDETQKALGELFESVM